MSAENVTVERPHNPLVRIFRTTEAFFPNRKPGVVFEAISYSGVYSHRGWENRLVSLDPDCRVIAEQLYNEFPELHIVFFERKHVTCEMSPGYDWTREKESLIIEILIS